ncbi:hypothetical protein BGZ65_010987, partial [Modicella reniformis]
AIWILVKLEYYKTKEIMEQVPDPQKTIKKMQAFRQRLEGQVEAIIKALKTPWRLFMERGAGV